LLLERLFKSSYNYVFCPFDVAIHVVSFFTICLKYFIQLVLQSNFDLVLSAVSADYAFFASCDDESRSCKRRADYASMNDDTHTMNFCSIFFNFEKDPKYKIDPTQGVINTCSTTDLRLAQRTRAAAILHEATHTTYAMRGNDP
jgi:hypothetical protein